VLDISKIEAGQFEMEMKPYHLGDLIKKVIETVTPAAQQKKLLLRVRVAPDVGAIVGDRRRVEQVLLNLVNNAIKFTDTGEVTVACEGDGELATIRVVDTGHGIKPDDIGKLFIAFQQLDAGLARRHDGTGLGLAICKRLVNLMGGEVFVESTWERGSTFTFTLPLQANVRESPVNAGK